MNLAGKYRPKCFSDVIGQKHIVEILQKQIEDKTIKQGYLFTGSAGTGKTTSARIIANEINGGKGGVIEIDAASNNGVENIRNIIENCKFKSMETEYKIYIIDEAHMLSTGAFNAFLKVLEEPPAHVIFILCTTDPQKIIPTVMSRLQRFDFKRVDLDTLVERLKLIIAWENDDIMSDGGPDEYYNLDDGAYTYIAKLANGGVRDAVSILDTVTGYQPDLTVTDVEAILNRVDFGTYIKFLDALQQKETLEALGLIRQLWMDGINLKLFIQEFTAFIVEASIYMLSDDSSFTSFPDTYLDDILDLDDIEPDLFGSLSELSAAIKYESNFRYIIEGWVMMKCTM